ncbi:MAG: adenylyltransferase/cytidyltransferase family protein [Chlamydiia bacterium]|nr:adenylyltransferase/cytidyltransferase family protein [Chlamydiia bacterium]
MHWNQEYLKKVVQPQDWRPWAASIRAQGKTIATLNGSFDLLHAGHLQILYEASLQADVFICALNSDASIKKYKSPLRPIIPLPFRMQMMAALEFVDFVTWFEETDPRAFLEAVRPDVHVNGSEYRENCIEQEVVEHGGGKVHFVDLIPGLSTTKILDAIKERA